MDTETPADPPLVPRPAFLALVVASASLGLQQRALLPTNGDAAWYLYMAGAVLDGARPYVDIVDTNPPLVLLLNMGVVAFARGLGLSPLLVFPTLVASLAAIALWLTWRIIRPWPLALRQASLLAWSFLLLVHVGNMYGQREHLLLILILPYACAAVVTADGGRLPTGLAIATGLMAGIGFGLKPFFLPAAAAVEVYLVARRGWRSALRPQAVAMGVVWLAYAALLLAWTPQYLDVARRFAPLYPYHQPRGPVLAPSSWRLPLVSLAFALAWWGGRRCGVRSWAAVQGLLAMYLALGVYLTGKGWQYHWYPAEAIALALLAGSVGLAAARSQPAHAWARAAILALVVPAVSMMDIVEWCALSGRDIAALRLVRTEGHDREPVLVLSTWVHRSFPMINEVGATWAMRHPMLWQVAAFYADGSWKPGHFHRLAAMRPTERRFVGEVAADFARNRPVLLLVDNDPPTPSLRGFDFLAYLSLDPMFARTLADYEFVAFTTHFRVYRRRSTGPIGSGSGGLAAVLGGG